MTQTYTHWQMESAVAISGDLHGHADFDGLVARHDQLQSASGRWQLCIDAALELEEIAQHLAVRWGDTHDYYLTIELFVEEIAVQPELSIPFAIQSALKRSACSVR